MAHARYTCADHSRLWYDLHILHFIARIYTDVSIVEFPYVISKEIFQYLNFVITDVVANFAMLFSGIFAIWIELLVSSVEEIHSVGTINNVETSHFTQLKMCYLMTTFRCPLDILNTFWLFTAGQFDGHRNVVIR